MEDPGPDSQNDDRTAELRKIAERCAALVRELYEVHGELLYDRDGVPT